MMRLSPVEPTVVAAAPAAVHGHGFPTPGEVLS